MGNESKNFSQIKKTSAVDQVCEAIKESIRLGKWEIGDRLPAESDLAAAFGVNRLTVRMALQTLNTLGVVETRTGSGTYVKLFDFDDYIKEVRDFYLEPEVLDSVCEFRRTLEIECVRLAIERATDEELDELEILLKRYQNLIFNSMDDEDCFRKLSKADIAFHRKICELSHNKLYLYSFTVAQSPIYQYMLLLNKKRFEAQANKSGSGAIAKQEDDKVDLHQQIFNALKARDFEGCRHYYLAMIDHNI